MYGEREAVPFRELDPVDRPISPYAATKRAAELLCHSSHHLFGLGVVVLRLFTAYGPRQRPDLAIHKFARLLREGRPLPVYGDGSSARDYTYVDDIVDGVAAALHLVVRAPATYEIVNLGESRAVALSEVIRVLAEEMGFVGVFVTLALYLLLLWRMLETARLARDRLGAFLVAGVSAAFAFQVVYNVGMVAGLVPVKGLPLPLMSYGGSSVVSSLMGIGLVLSVRMRRFAN